MQIRFSFVMMASSILGALGLAPGTALLGPWAARTPLFADGSVNCTGADDTSHRIGSVALWQKGQGVAFRVEVELGPGGRDWPYYVELSQGGTCQAPLQFHGFTTDPRGNGVFTGYYPTDPGKLSILVDVVGDAGADPPDPNLRELAPAKLIHVFVPDLGITNLTLAFDAGPGGVPWSEQGFTFDGTNASVPGQFLRQWSFQRGWGFSLVTLQRADGGTFDALSLNAEIVTTGLGGWASVESDYGGYQELVSGLNNLQGPGWDGIPVLYIFVEAAGDLLGDIEVFTDYYLVRVR